jgi:hypothetical protein
MRAIKNEKDELTQFIIDKKDTNIILILIIIKNETSSVS